MNRREMVAASSAALLVAGRARAQGQPDSEAFSWEALVRRAQALSTRAYVDVPAHPGAAKVGYDALHEVRFRDERTLWNDAADSTGVRFFPLSGTANQPIFLHLVEGGRARPIRYDPAYFDMPPDSPVAALGADAGFAGFRVMNAARDADWLVFMGASYFRAAGGQKQYGLSARAVTVDTSVGPEEFPRFTHFWLEKTGPASLTVYALLDGPSVAGAYRFANALGAAGVGQDIDAVLFPRKAIRELGLMPMTSMFWYDQAHRGRATDWRPEVHDSDGLLIRAADGAAHFRPLINPAWPRASVFVEPDTQGFGLLQRDRNFDHYQDDGVFYDRRPSLFATPRKPLGKGQVRLYEFQTGSEYTDNVATFWTPASPVRPGRRMALSYRLDWQADAPPPARPAARPLAVVRDIWRGTSDADAGQGRRPAIRLVADFEPIDLRPGQAELWVELGKGSLIKKAAYPVIGRPGVWRAVIDVAPEGGDAAEIRAQFRSGQSSISEMLHYPLVP